MKLKELDRNGFMAWSPKSTDKSYLVVGTAFSQQLNSSFSSKSQLEIFEYDPTESGSEMSIVRSVGCDTRFSKLLWGNVSEGRDVIVGGAENGSISIFDYGSLMNDRRGSRRQTDMTDDDDENGGAPRVTVKKDHKGPVHAMDFNKFKPNLLATGGDESDIFIWDLEKFEEPMTPGNKSQPLEEIRSLSWNHKVQHILGSTSTHRCQIWDLRKSDPVIKLSDTQMKMKCKKIVWHPDISTRLCISSEDDHTPVIQLWDLRYIQCPFHTLQRHTKGIVDLEWCLDDPDILMSVGRDRQLICWNMSSHNTSNTVDSSSEIIYEWQLDQELISEAHFCPKHPGLVSVSSFDCHISLYSLMGGRGHVSRELSDTVTDSFPLELNEEDNDEIERIKKEAEKAAELQLVPTPCLMKAPKWLKRPCGARFSFGGKLVQFYKTESSRSRNNSISSSGSISPNENGYKVFISQVIVHKDLVESSKALDNAIRGPDSLIDYCQNKVELISSKIQETDNRNQKSIFQFDLDIWKFIECHFIEDSRSAFMQNLGYGDSMLNDKEHLDYDKNIDDNFPVSHDEQVYLTSEAYEFPLNDIKLLPKYEGTEKSLSVSLMTGNIDSAIEICLNEERSGEAAILAVSSGRQDLFEKVQKHIFQKTIKQSLTTQLIYIAVKRNWNELVNKCDLSHWKETLAWLLTYASTEELSELCEILGNRLEEREAYENSNCSHILSACICYICSGSVDNFVRCWLKINSLRSTKDLQRLIEMIVLLCKSIGDDDFSSINGKVAEVLHQYASLIVSQGGLSTAIKYLGDSNNKDIMILKHRISERLQSRLPSGVVAPKIPFNIQPILASVTKPKPILQHISSVPPSLSENITFPNQVPSFKTPVSYQLNQGNIVNNIMKPPAQKIIPNDPPLNFIPSQFNQNPSQPPLSNNLPHNYVSPSYNLPSSGLTTCQLPFIPQQINNTMPNTAPPLPIPAQIPAQMTSNQINKSGWNDPPLLSENYRSESNKEEIKVQQNFFNPTSSITDISELPSIGNMMNLNANVSGPTPNSFSSFNYMNSSEGYNISKMPEVTRTPSASECIMAENEVPAEYKHIQKVLINLIEKCRDKDKSRQTKVKMDDIQKKIHNIFNQLKIQSVSPELSKGLVGLASTLEANNYRQSFEDINHLIQTVNFSEAGVFLPSIKMLIQCAIRIFE